MSNILKIVPDSLSTGTISISYDNENFPLLMYKTPNDNKTISILCESSREKLIKCSELKQILLGCINRGTKFIIDSGYDSDRKLYYLNPDQRLDYCDIKDYGYGILPYVYTSRLSKDYPNAFNKLSDVGTTDSIILDGRKDIYSDASNLAANRTFKIVAYDKDNTESIETQNFETDGNKIITFFGNEGNIDYQIRVSKNPDNITYGLSFVSENTKLGILEIDYNYEDIKNIIDEFIQKTVNVYKDTDPDYPFPIIREDPDVFEELRSYLGSSDYDKEIRDNQGKYSLDVLNNSETFELIPNTVYTDTIDLSFIINKLSRINLSAEVSLGISYSITEDIIVNTLVSFEAFRIEQGELIYEDIIFDKGLIQIEYFNNIIRVFPKSIEVKECIISNCLINYGKL